MASQPRQLKTTEILGTLLPAGHGLAECHNQRLLALAAQLREGKSDPAPLTLSGKTPC